MPSKSRTGMVIIRGGTIDRSAWGSPSATILPTTYATMDQISYGVSPGYPKNLVTNLLFSTHLHYRISQGWVSDMKANNGYYDGPVWVNPPAAMSRNPALESNSGFGAKAFAQAAPTRKVADAAQILGELRDLPRMVKSTMELGRSLMSILPRRRLNISNPGDQYLNLQFGWVPFVSSVKKLIDAQESIDKRVKQVLRDNGKLVRRSTTVRSSTNQGQTTTVDGSGHMRPFGGGISGKTTTQTIVTDRVWATFGFRYWLPQPNPIYGDRTISDRLRRELLGGDVSISTIWELTPWSWLTDWFVDTGSVLENMVSQQRYNLVAQYGSLMHQTDYTSVRSVVSPIQVSPDRGRYTQLFPSSVSGTSSTVFTVKQRNPTGPFGNGFNFSGLNPYQLSILGALGLSRAT